jgi:hypothetical protein
VSDFDFQIFVPICMIHCVRLDCETSTYDDGPPPPPTPPPPSGQAHYGNPATGCLSDEGRMSTVGVPGDWCSAGCNNNGACPQDKPVTVTANPQCLSMQGGGGVCALVCATSLPIWDQKAADSQCGTATCQPASGQPFGLCTYSQGPSPGQTHYGDPVAHGSGQGCLSDETNCAAKGVPGTWCCPACSSGGSCPQDKPVGVTANPQCFDRCALVCAVSLPIIDQKAADSQCGAATCHPGPGHSYGLCTYADGIETGTREGRVATGPSSSEDRAPGRLA